MSLKAKIILTYYYFLNAYRMLWTNSVAMLLAVFLLFSVGNLSQSLIRSLNQEESRDYLLTMGNDDLVGLDDEGIVRFNSFFEGKIALKRLDTKDQFSTKNLKGDIFELSLLSEDSIHESALIVSDLIAEAYDILIGDSLIIGGRVFVVVQILELDHDVDGYLAKRSYHDLLSHNRTKDSSLIMTVSDGFDSYLGLDYVNNLLGRNVHLYGMDLVDFSGVLLAIIKLVRNFLLIVAGLIFVVSMFMIRNVVYISVMDRTEELVVLRSFGLSMNEVLQLLIIEVLILVLIGLSVAFVLSIVFGLVLSYVLGLVFVVEVTFNLIIVVVVLGLTYLSTLISSRGLNRVQIHDLD